MSRLYSFIILICICCLVCAQTQQGIVKTRGRMVNGTKVSGVFLSGATIKLNIGHTLISGKDGRFSFVVPASKRYSLITVTKQGYTLADPDYVNRLFSYSSQNPYFVVLEDEAQRQADINSATRKVRKTLSAQIEKREEELRELRIRNDITEIEYQRLMSRLNDDEDRAQGLVKEMAERYVSIDYDQLNEFDQKIQQYIEDGELQKADSMIRIKGNIEERIEKYHKTVAANKDLRQQLEQSEAGTAKTLLELSQDLHNRYNIFAQKLQIDSALYCLKLRAELDTANIQNTIDYADLLLGQNHHRNAEKYYNRALVLCEQNGDSTNIAYIWHQLGNLFFDTGKRHLAEQYYQKELGYRNNLVSDNMGKDSLNIGRIYNNLGNIYRLDQEFIKAEQAYQKAYEIEHKLYVDGTLANQETEYWGLLHNFGLQYYDTKQPQKSLKYFLEAIEGLTMLCERDSSRYNLSVLAKVYDNVARTYQMVLNFSSTEKYFSKSKDIYDKLSHKNPERYLPNLANLYHDIGLMYLAKTDNEKALDYFLMAKEKYSEVQILRGNDDKNTELPQCYEDVGIAYLNLHNYELAIENLSVAISMYENISHAQDNKSIRSRLAHVYMVLGSAQDKLNDKKSVVSMSQSVRLYKELYEENPIVFWGKYIDALIEKGNMYTNDISKWNGILEDAMHVIDDVKNISDIDSISIVNSTGKIELNMGNYYWHKNEYEHAISHALHALDCYEYLYSKEPGVYSERLVTTNTLLSAVYYLSGKKDCAKSILMRTYMMSDSLFHSNIHTYYAVHSFLLYSFAYIEYENKDYKSARKYLEELLKVIEIGQDNGIVSNNITFYGVSETFGKMLYESGDYPDAVKLLGDSYGYYVANPSLINEKRPDYAQLLYMLAVAHANIEGHEQQRDTFTILVWEQTKILYEQDSLRYKKNFVDMQNYAAYYFMTNEMSEKAIALTRETYKLDKDASIGYLAGALNCRANEYLREQRYGLALETVEEALALQPESTMYLDTKGEILLLIEKTQEALVIWHKILELNPNFLDNHPEGTNLSNGLNKLGLIE